MGLAYESTMDLEINVRVPGGSLLVDAPILYTYFHTHTLKYLGWVNECCDGKELKPE